MKPKLILCLALVLSGGWFGCSTSSRLAARSDEPRQKSESNGLAGWVSVPSLKLDPYALSAYMNLKNISSKPIRICYGCEPHRSISPGGERNVIFLVGGPALDPIDPEDLSKYVTELKPDETLKLPFDVAYVGTLPDFDDLGTNGTIHLTAEFRCVTKDVPENLHLHCWYGDIKVKPLTLKVEP